MAKLLFTGSDVLFSTWLFNTRKFPTKKSKWLYFIGYYLFIKMCDLFVESFYVVNEHLIDELKPLKLKKPIRVLVDPPVDVSSIMRKKHDRFNVIYYCPFGSNQVFIDWLYGFDFAQKVAKHYEDTDVNIIRLNGKSDMNYFYSIADFVLRPNRHDGQPRMIMECSQLGIPYYWSKDNPSVKEAINLIEIARFNKTQRTYSED